MRSTWDLDQFSQVNKEPGMLLGEGLIGTGPWWVVSPGQHPLQITFASLSSASHLLTFPPLPDKMCFCVAPLHQQQNVILVCWSYIYNAWHLAKKNQTTKTRGRKQFSQIFRVLSRESALYASTWCDVLLWAASRSIVFTLLWGEAWLGTKVQASIHLHNNCVIGPAC